ncbi:MAG TPA: mercury resistance system periplasmic binding protein MerP [Bradyrhizobium sp.]|uniref:mercury resistance system periplasmic binding protein MerP n=1 Tax=Bradyrhizobium sp. TaxID=376 RepID=UPI002C6D7BF2|nr:mercury resistance system periplasmic binding protein MerP [Bradyrhizobium sp.]HLZ05473.1 mercury resistance system periplasmic binding protein MerP [Bradyrhizobium sp.]
MSRLLACAILGLGTMVSSAAMAGERNVTLAVSNMYCAACPHTVKASLEAVSGVSKVVVSSKDKTAIVTYDDARTDVKALTEATTNAGYPSTPKT